MKVGEYDTDRYDRMRRIRWLNINALKEARCLVVGAGALGNEAVKCMALAGFGNITVTDMDDVAVSNLSRCVFFADSDRGGNKSEILSKRASELNPEITITPVKGKIQDSEDWDYDVIIGCLDNISARLHVNSRAKYHRIPYVDGATDGFRGKVQVILPDGPCMECAVNGSHMGIMDKRFSCTGNSVMYVPKTASEITTTSIIAATQVREAMKILSGRSNLCLRSIMYYDGESGESDIYELSVDPGCPNHERERLQ
jgi:molybdopterin/thiamine biosynthesis adenylyltransferase